MHSTEIRQLVTPQGLRGSIEVNASLHGSFFEADKPAHSSEASSGTTGSSELTFYRRNLFKVNATVSIPQTAGNLKLADDHLTDTIVGLSAQIRATESLKGDSVNLIKASKDSINGVQPLPISIELEQTNPQSRISRSPYLISWERLQFRNSTIKSTRSISQNYRIIFEVMGILSGGSMVSLSRSESPSIIVRGRSPKNYLQNRRNRENQIHTISSGPETVVADAPFCLHDDPALDMSRRLSSDSCEIHLSETRSSVESARDIPANSADEEELEGDYTYIPIPIMDWSPPVEAVFVRFHLQLLTFSAITNTEGI
jgi:hypothetical protein